VTFKERAMSKHDHYINDIAIDPNRLNIIEFEKKAAIEFGKLNRWTYVPHSELDFDLEDISPKRYERAFDYPRKYQFRYLHHLIDHGLYYTCKSNPIAIVAQPYNINVDEARIEFRRDLNLEIYLPPDPLASFWFPGFTFFAVLAAPNMNIKWLPEQDGRYIHRWELRRTEFEKTHAS
jgi:hypothetical protein